MKKSLVFGLVFILIAAATGFSADYEFTVSGEASVTWGIDLDYMMTGFVNASASDLVVTLVAEQDAEKGSDDDGAVYGYIFLENFKLMIDTDDGGWTFAEPGITAKIMAKPLYVKIYGAADTDIDVASIANGDAELPIGMLQHNNSVAYSDNATGGITVGLDTDVVDAELYICSESSYVDSSFASVNTDDNTYYLGLKVGLVAVENLTLNVYAGYQIGETTAGMDDLGIGAEVGYKIAISDDMSITPWANFDMVMENEASLTTWEISSGVTLGWPGSNDDNDFPLLAADKDFPSGVKVGFNLFNDGTDMWGDLVATIFEQSGDDGLLPMIGFTASAELANLLAPAGNDMDLSFSASFDVTIDGIKPYAAVVVKNLMEAVAAPNADIAMNAFVKVGVDIPIFANTTLTIDWTTDDILATENIADVDSITGDGNGALGDITVKVKIAF